MSEAVVYSSEAQSVLSAWREFENIRRRFNGRVSSIAEDMGIPAVINGRTSQIIGLHALSSHVPDGWQVNEGERLLTPDRGTKIGQEWGARFDQANGDCCCVLPGMPNVLCSRDGRRHEPGIRLIDGTIWVTWPIGLEGHYDVGLWSQGLITDLMAAIEDARPVVQEMCSV